ncbi:malto-oligosyltrehalose trehalohydrolase [Phormidium pseudopriestleyi FRX01]|uniref:Malto-oligosyltrehalose trehalohydrolase n=1 Tax=Phormidium pseudopriestleyi FRX01 TaxID=1759528 RepID=A0ABS3FQQ7_9CYAN|nr:malto-oligosyltrehalose trehalohydrolase [Phormidium pseudopriestleyi]MBO0349314.1 malto-oligosyltrehalose trehalohydrolase [Phormidium pseudopriestleyi FRX01]
MTVTLGSNYLGNDRCEFTVWAPTLKEVAVVIAAEDEQRAIAMERQAEGYWKATAEGIAPGTRYFYRLNDNLMRADPAAHLQPDGVHGASAVVDLKAFSWSDRSWCNLPLSEYIIYELHVGTFTPEGTFEAIIPRLGVLKDLGINAIEIMPVAQFPGDRNWGYDGVFPYAVQNSYGGPHKLKQLVDACHQQGIAVLIDVVYNHIGPEGNYLADFGPYFTNKYRPIWGEPLNFDEEYSDGVRHFFIENALYWLREYHIDGLRLDAIQGIFETGARPFLQQMADAVADLSEQKGRKFYLTAESDLNDVRVLRPKELGGYGLDSQWCDDFHHVLHTLLTGENDRYYKDFGQIQQLVKSFKEGFVYDGQYAPHRKRRHGNSAKDQPAYQFIVFSQNHDQTGNRIAGDRLSHLISFDGLKLAAATVLLSPFLPLLFMGEEYGETAPFLYFVSHSDPDLIEAIRQDKEKEFKQAFKSGKFNNPQDANTFYQCQINWEYHQQGQHQVLWNFYRRLIELRRTIPALKKLSKKTLDCGCLEAEKLLFVRRWAENSQVFYMINFSTSTVQFEPNIPDGNWQKILDSSEESWKGPGSSLPEVLQPQKSISIPALTVAVYQISG